MKECGFRSSDKNLKLDSRRENPMGPHSRDYAKVSILMLSLNPFMTTTKNIPFYKLNSIKKNIFMLEFFIFKRDILWW